jgi:uncharacterized protein
MPNKQGNDDRLTGAGDRERHRDVSTDSARQHTSVPPSVASRTRSSRGFASMDPGKQKEIASKGGRAAHAKGTAHEFDSSEAREAGRKGGMAVSRNREHMAAIGRRGGEARGHSRARAGAGGAQTNSGAATGSEGGLQNTTRQPGAGEREVPVSRDTDGVSANLEGTRNGSSSLGGERRPNDDQVRGESF